MLVTMSQHEVFLSYLSRCEVDLRALVGAAMHDFHAGEEVFQEIALTLWQNFSQYDPSRPFGAWARGVAAKKLMERFRRDRRRPLVFSPESIRKLVEAAERSDLRPGPDFEALDHCLGKLPAKSRQLLRLRYGQDQPVAAVAAQTRAAETAVCQALSRLRRRLRDCMERYMAARSCSADVV
jgi:RNA polymerase sigma-70 factor (ECF subfamily)